MTTKLKRWLMALTFGATMLAVGGPSPAGAVDVGDDVVIEDAIRGVQYGIAFNPERDEYLGGYSTSGDVKVVRLGTDGSILSGPTTLQTDLGFQRFDTDVSYNDATNQYLVSWSQVVPVGSTTRTVSLGQLISDTGTPVGSPVQLHPLLGTHLRCSSVWPQHEANPATGGYTVLYTYWYSTTSDNGPCDGLDSGETRTVVSSLGGDLSLGASVNVAGANSGIKDNHLAVNPQTGDILVLQRMPGPSGRATMYSPTLQQDGSFQFINDDRPNNNEIQDPVAASDPATGNWLITWEEAGDGVTMIVDAAGDEVVAPSTRLNRHVLEVDAAGDGSYWGVSDLGYLVHVGADGTEISSLQIARSGGHPALAIGAAEAGVRGLAFMPTGGSSIPTVVPFSESPTRPLPPMRILETRVGTPDGTADDLFEGIGVRRAGETLTLQVSGRGGVPAGADSVFLNIAAARASDTGFVTAYPCDEDVPTSSNLNFGQGAAASSAAFVKLSADGTACLFTSADVDLIVDVNGFVPSSALLASVVPARLLETRAGTPNGTIDGRFEGEGRLTAGTTLELDVAGRGGVDDDAESVLVNVTAVRPSARLFVTVFPCGQAMPTAASLNAEANVNVTNLALAKVGDDGGVCVFSSGDTDLIVDVSAYVPAGGGVVAQTPERLVETRTTPDGTVDDREQAIGRFGADTERTFVLAGRGSVPDNAGGVVLNVAAVNPDTNGFITLHPCDERPAASNVNFAAGTVVSNGAFVALSSDGEVCVYSSAGTDIAIDVVGFTIDA